MEKLNLCPGCKAAAKVQGDEYSVRVVCSLRCGWCTEWDNDPEVVKGWWNTRATDPLLKEMAEALEDLDDMFDPTSRVGEIISKALQKYHERESTQC